MRSVLSVLCLSILFPCGLLASDREPVILRASVEGIVPDELDPENLYLTLRTEGEPVFLALPAARLSPLEPENLIDAKVLVSNITWQTQSEIRPFLGLHATITGSEDIHILKPPAPGYPFNSKPLYQDNDVGYKNILASGRRSFSGYVKAVWSKRRFLLEDQQGRFCLVDLCRDASPPAYGDFVCAVGIPETDFIRINLINGIWRHETASYDPPPETITAVETGAFYRGKNGKTTINTGFHGMTVRLRGTIITPPYQGFDARPFYYLESGDHVVMIKQGERTSVLSSIRPGAVVEITATCILHSGIAKQNIPFPPVFGFVFVTRTDRDVTIIRQPPWWTSRHLLATISLLLLALVAVFIWNRSLRHLVDRKSRQLARERISQARAELRITERTNLAVELHDSISQNLSGISCQIAAVKSAIASGSATATSHAETADRMLRSCRTSLQHCLWDLRENTLEDVNFTDALRKTLTPIAIGTRLNVRCNVPRTHLSDATAHAIICIVRELVSNAVRHGKASNIRVAGACLDGEILFSIRDDGVGFDMTACAGPAEGHFGLQGIAERIRRLNGTLDIRSSPGHGTKVKVILRPLPLTRHEHDHAED